MFTISLLRRNRSKGLELCQEETLVKENLWGILIVDSAYRQVKTKLHSQLRGYLHS